MAPKGKSIDTGSRLVLARGWGREQGVPVSGQMGSLRVTETFRNWIVKKITQLCKFPKFIELYTYNE